MSKTKKNWFPNFHDDPDVFRESINFTAGQSGFSATLVEKDYFCTLLLMYLKEYGGGGLIFKGGTSFSKVYFDFYRLSEDLDFIIPMPIDAKRKERSSRVEKLKKAIPVLPDTLPVFHIKEKLRGANNSSQYLSTIGYISFVDGSDQTIMLEVGLREPILLEPTDSNARTILLNAINSKEAIQPYDITCLSINESMAEKFRAALTRREVAIRDFYDIDYASRKGMQFDDTGFIDMIRKKLNVPGNDPPDTSNERLEPLRSQLETRLKPVLRPRDYETFELDRAIDIVKMIHKSI